MIRVDDARLYARSLESLSAFAGRNYRGRLVQIFLAAKYYGASIPRVGSGFAGIKVAEFQHVLDAFYKKRSRPDADGSIVMIFQDNHLVPTGQVGPGLRTPSNIWRNNLGLQKAMICYASEAELADDAFLRQPRVECPHLRPAVRGSLRGARCGLQLAASYRNEDGPKGLRRDPVDGGYSIVNPDRLDHWARIVTPEIRRIPVLPLIVSLYHDSEMAAGRDEIDTVDFRRDFNFSLREYVTYFDDDPAAHGNRALVRRFPQLALEWTEAPNLPPVDLGAPPPARREIRRRARGGQGPIDPDDLPELAPRSDPPAGGHWWSAEQAVEAYLRASGWTVINRTRQPVGFDLEISRRGSDARFFIEVKSSVGQCAPVLTRNEFEAAGRHGSRYVLAIVENFDPNGPASILWVRNPAGLPLRARTVEQYPVPRSVWLRGANLDLQ